MEELLQYRTDNLPDHIRCQILSFLRIHYLEGFVGRNRLRKWISPEYEHPIYVVLIDDGVLISHTEVKWKYLVHGEETYKVYGLSGVFTYPAFQKQGYGRRIVEAGTRYILSTDADLGMFHCSPDLGRFYAASGWLSMDEVVTLYRERSHPKISSELAMMMFLSPKAQSNRHTFEKQPVYFGSSTW